VKRDTGTLIALRNLRSLKAISPVTNSGDSTIRSATTLVLTETSRHERTHCHPLPKSTQRRESWVNPRVRKTEKKTASVFLSESYCILRKRFKLRHKLFNSCSPNILCQLYIFLRIAVMWMKYWWNVWNPNQLFNQHCSNFIFAKECSVHWLISLHYNIKVSLLENSVKKNIT
jgi:hypothetical protein